MKVLWLGTSNDIPRAEVPEAEQTHKLMEPRLAAILGEPVEITAKALWPTPDVPEIVGRWVERYEPDLVYVKINKFWYMHESIPLRIERAFGPLGRPIRRFALGVNDTPWVAHNRVFHRVRRFARNHIDGAYHMEPEEVVQRLSQALRMIVRREGTQVFIAGAFGIRDDAPNEKIRIRREGRRQAVHQGIKRIAAELHLDYLGEDQPRYDRIAPRPQSLGPDGFHSDVKGHRDAVDRMVDMVLPSCRKVIEGCGTARVENPSQT